MADVDPNEPVNPYGAPIATAIEVKSPTGEVAASTIHVLERMRGWVLTLAFLSALGSGGSAIITIGSFFAFSQGQLDTLEAPQLTMVWMFYLLMSIVYAFIALRLFQFVIRVSRLRSQPTVERLNHALEAQRSFWNIAGAAAVIVLFIMAFAFLLGMWAAFA